MKIPSTPLFKYPLLKILLFSLAEKCKKPLGVKNEAIRIYFSDVPITGPPIIDLFRLLKSDYSIFRLKNRFLIDFLFIKIKK